MRALRLAAALAAALALPTPASAGFFDFTLAPYVGLSGGQSTTDSCIIGTCDDTDSAYKVFGGLEVNEYISMEAGYLNLGKVSYTTPAVGSRDTSGAILQIVGSVPISDSFKLLVRGGMNILNTEVHGATEGAGNKESDTDISWSAGLGAQYNVTNALGVRVEWERFFEVGDASTTLEADIDLVSAGIVYRF